jgi:hypothetical protein
LSRETHLRLFWNRRQPPEEDVDLVAVDVTRSSCMTIVSTAPHPFPSTHKSVQIQDNVGRFGLLVRRFWIRYDTTYRLVFAMCLSVARS